MLSVRSFVGKYFPDVPFKGGKVKCPAHNDPKASLAIKMGDRNLLLNCHAGCSFEAVAKAINLDPADVSPSRNGMVKPKKPKVLRSGGTAQTVVDAYERALDSRVVETYVYRTVNGVEIRALRFDPKDFRQMSQLPDGTWSMAIPDNDLVLPWELEDCSADGPIWIDESEKACQALRKLGVSATSTLMGATALGRTDLSVLRHRRTLCWPHNDEGGELYADELEEQLGTVVLPAWGAEHADVEDWIAAGGTLEALLALSEQPSTEPVVPKHCIPETLWTAALGISSASGCPMDIALLSLYPVLGAAIGTKTVVEVKPGFTQPASFYAVIWGDTGDGKSHPMSHVAEGLRAEDRRRHSAHVHATACYDKLLAKHKKSMQAYLRDKGDGEPPGKPEEPLLDLLYIDDTTVEAMESQLIHGTGKLLYVDEGMQWYCGAGQYKSSGGAADKAKHNTWWNGKGTTTVRQKEIRKTADKVSVSMLMGCQIDTMAVAMDGTDLSTGLFGRMLMGMYPVRTPAPEPLDADTAKLISDTTQLLLGATLPSVMHVEDGVAEWWNIHVHEWQQDNRLSAGDGTMRGAWAKLAGYVARIALVHHVLDRELYEAGDVIPLARFQEAFELIKRWQVPVQRQAYAGLAVKKTGEQGLVKSLKLVRDMGGFVTARDFSRKTRKKKAEVERIFKGMALLDWGSVNATRRNQLTFTIED